MNKVLALSLLAWHMHSPSVLADREMPCNPICIEQIRQAQKQQLPLLHSCDLPQLLPNASISEANLISASEATFSLSNASLHLSSSVDLAKSPYSQVRLTKKPLHSSKSSVAQVYDTYDDLYQDEPKQRVLTKSCPLPTLNQLNDTSSPRSSAGLPEPDTPILEQYRKKAHSNKSSEARRPRSREGSAESISGSRPPTRSCSAVSKQSGQTEAEIAKERAAAYKQNQQGRNSICREPSNRPLFYHRPMQGPETRSFYPRPQSRQRSRCTVQ